MCVISDPKSYYVREAKQLRDVTPKSVMPQKSVVSQTVATDVRVPYQRTTDVHDVPLAQYRHANSGTGSWVLFVLLWGCPDWCLRPTCVRVLVCVCV